MGKPPHDPGRGWLLPQPLHHLEEGELGEEEEEEEEEEGIKS